jgi:hypothetical protein
VRFSKFVPVPAAFVKSLTYRRDSLRVCPPEGNPFRTGFAQRGVNAEAYDDFVGMRDAHLQQRALPGGADQLGKPVLYVGAGEKEDPAISFSAARSRTAN